MNDIEGCFETLTPKLFCLKEAKTQFYINNDLDKPVIKVKVDNCLIKDGKRCDWLLLLCEIKTEIYIELKGKNIEDALKQLEITSDNKSLRKILENRYHYKQPIKNFCCVIYTRCPLDQPSIENVKKRFRSKGIILKFLSSNSDKRPQKLSNLVQ